MTDVQAVLDKLAAAEAALKQTTVGYVNKRWTVPPAGTNWANGLGAISDARTLLATTVPLYFNGDLQAGDLSQWSDFHDAHLSSIPPGVLVVPRPGGGYMGRVLVPAGSSTSTTGDATFLWEGGDYKAPWLSKGADTWFRQRILFPDGTNASYPGRFTPSQPVSSGWDTVWELHDAPGAGYSTCLMVWGSSPPCLMFRPCGGIVGTQTYQWVHEKVGGDRTAADKPLQWNHWYDVLIHLVLTDDPAVGFAEWWVDDVLQYAAHTPTLTKMSDGSVPGVGLEVGLYRGQGPGAPVRTDVDTVYMSHTKAGPSRASVGG
jgi:hypothetical protein